MREGGAEKCSNPTTRFAGKVEAGIEPVTGSRRPSLSPCGISRDTASSPRWVPASAASPEHEQVLAWVGDLAVHLVGRLEEVDPVAVQLLTAVTE
jgi:hypothetical protein